MKVGFRPAVDEDRDAVRDIFNYYATHGHAVYREDEIDGSIFDFFAKDAFAFLVAENPRDGIVGFGALRKYKPAATFDRTGVLTYFLKPDFAGWGIGTRLLSELSDIARRRRIRNLLAHISSRNLPSLRFHVKHGFAEVGRLHDVGVKFGEPFDVVWVQKRLD